MSRPIPAKRGAEVVAVVAKARSGVAFLELFGALNPPAPARNLKRWLRALVRQKRLIRVGRSSATRYKLPDVMPAAGASVGAPPVSEAVRRLVTLPLRPPADYRRIVLERYRPNETYYLPMELRVRMLATRDGGAWRQKAVYDRIVANLASRCLSVEDALDAAAAQTVVSPGRRPGVTGVRPLAPLTDADVLAWLAEPERAGVRPDVQFLWNIRAALVMVVSQGATGAVTPGLLNELYARVTTRLLRPTPTEASPAYLRRAVLELRGTTYCPPADPWVIESCCATVLRLAAAIADPVERAFFLLTHLLYLQPFGAFNLTMTLLAANVPLLATGLPPVTLAAVSLDELIAAMRGVWELNRTELLADAFAARCS